MNFLCKKINFTKKKRDSKIRLPIGAFMKFTATNNIEVREEVVFRSNKDGSIVVMKMNDDDMFYKINGVAAEMWQKFSEKKSNLGDVANELSKNYSIPS
jgi:hypothetical protein